MQYISGAEIKTASILKIAGNTYPHREEIKSRFGATFSKASGCWIVKLDGMANGQRTKLAAITFEMRGKGLDFSLET